MERNRTEITVDWESKRFGINFKGLSPHWHFFDDKDFKEAVDEQLGKCTVVGNADKIELLTYDIPQRPLVFRHKDRALFVSNYDSIRYSR